MRETELLEGETSLRLKKPAALSSHIQMINDLSIRKFILYILAFIVATNSIIIFGSPEDLTSWLVYVQTTTSLQERTIAKNSN